VNVEDIKLDLKPQTFFLVAVTETSAAEVVALALVGVREQIASKLGPRRLGPVGALWWNDPEAVENVLQVLARNDIPHEEARAQLAAHAGGALVVGFADCLPGGVG
jgi:hypothetical protein